MESTFQETETEPEPEEEVKQPSESSELPPLITTPLTDVSGGAIDVPPLEDEEEEDQEKPLPERKLNKLNGFPKHPITDHQFVGVKPPIAPYREVDDLIRPKFLGLYNSAQQISLSRDNRLPWELDIHGKLYSTPSDEAMAKINYLRAMLGKNKFVRPLSNERPPEWNEEDSRKDWAKNLLGFEQNDSLLINERQTAFACNQLVALELDQKLLEDENKFRINLRQWITGDADDEEYKNCFWMLDKNKMKQRTKQKLHNDLETIYTEGERKNMVRSFPRVTQGFVTDMDVQPARVKSFLKKLAKKVPTNEEEAYLWYKYIVKKHVVDLRYIAKSYEPKPHNDTEVKQESTTEEVAIKPEDTIPSASLPPVVQKKTTTDLSEYVSPRRKVNPIAQYTKEPATESLHEEQASEEQASEEQLQKPKKKKKVIEAPTKMQTRASVALIKKKAEPSTQELVENWHLLGADNKNMTKVRRQMSRVLQEALDMEPNDFFEKYKTNAENLKKYTDKKIWTSLNDHSLYEELLPLSIKQRKDFMEVNSDFIRGNRVHFLNDVEKIASYFDKPQGKYTKQVEKSHMQRRWRELKNVETSAIYKKYGLSEKDVFGITRKEFLDRMQKEMRKAKLPYIVQTVFEDDMYNFNN